MLSLRSLAFILYSAIRRARALSCAALHCSPDRAKALMNARKMATKLATNTATNTATNLAASMCSLLRTAYLPGDHRSGRAKGRLKDQRTFQAVPMDAILHSRSAGSWSTCRAVASATGKSAGQYGWARTSTGLLSLPRDHPAWQGWLVVRCPILPIFPRKICSKTYDDRRIN